MGCATSREEKVTGYDTEDGAAKDEAGKKSRALGRAMSSDSFVFAEENTQADAMSTAGRRGKEVAAEDVLPVNEHLQDGVTYWVEHVDGGQVFADEQSEENDPDIIGK